MVNRSYISDEYNVLSRSSMRPEVDRFKDGRLMVKVVFEPNSNFRKETLSWVPTFEEIDRIVKALEGIDDVNIKYGKVSVLNSHITNL